MPNPEEPKKKAPKPTVQMDAVPSSTPEEDDGPVESQAEGDSPTPSGSQPTIRMDAVPSSTAEAEGRTADAPQEAPPAGSGTPASEAASGPPSPAREGGGEDEDPLVGTLLREKWEVLKRLGAGSFGTVYKVRDVKGGWIEALKILGVERITGAEAETVRARFLREAQIMKRLGTQSAHIVGLSTYEEDLEAGLIYFLMEFVEGPSLGDELEENGPFSVQRTVKIALQVCDALIVAHHGEDGVVHRDLKLENIMLTKDRSGEEVAKVLDFGIAKIAEREADAKLTQAGTLGTPGFAAPEQLRAEEVDGRTDLFAFGVILYSLLSGKDPWFGKPTGEPSTQVYELMVATERAEMIPMDQTGVEVPPALAGVVTRLLRRDPADRFQDAKELKAVLERIASGDDALDQAFLQVITEEPGVEVVVRSGRKVVAQGPTPLKALGIRSGSYKVQVVDPRFEETETALTLASGAMEDITVVTTPRAPGLGATLARKKGLLATAVLVVLLLAGGLLVQPWGRTLSLPDLQGRAVDGSVAAVRLEGREVRGQMAVLGIPAPFVVPLEEQEGTEVVEELRGAGLTVDTSWEVARLIALAQDAQRRTAYFGTPGSDVMSFASEARALDPESPEARSLLLKVAERMTWDAEAAMGEGRVEEARELVEECLRVVPDHPGCAGAMGTEG